MESWLAAKVKIPNISEYLSECLKGISGRSSEELKETDIKDKIEAATNSINDLTIKKSILEMELKQLIESNAQQKLELRRKEDFKRWICPICHKPKMLETRFCDNCGLNTRPKDETKTEYTYIEG
jgi:transcriptional regulator CtsR